MPKIFIYILIIIPVIVISIGVIIYIFQERLIFQPDKLSEKFQFNFLNSFKEKNYITPNGESINSLLFTALNSKGLVFYNHGNSFSLEYWGTRANDFVNKGYDVFMYDYRGFGKSTGKIKNEKMIYNDAVFLYKDLLNKYDEKNVIIMGMSLGTGIASKLAYENNPKMLILETPYFNFYDVSKFHYPYLPNSILLHYQFKTNQWLKNCKYPIYLFHGTEDQTVPYDSSVRLKKICNKITLFTIVNGSHNNLNSFDDYQENLKTILK